MSTHKTRGHGKPFVLWIVQLILPLVLGATLVSGQGRTVRKPNASSQPTTTKGKSQTEPSSTVVGSGEVWPTRYVKLTSEIPGRIQRVYVEPGEEVRKGQALVLVEPQSSERKHATRYSPLKGVIADIPTRVGETVLGGVLGTTLMTIADMSKIYVEVNVEEADVSKIAVGHPARIMVDAFGEKEIRGLVIRKNPIPVAQADTKEFRITLEMRDVPQAIRNRLRPGMSATAIITTSTTFPLRAQLPCRKQPIEDLVKAVTEAYEAKTLGILDARKPYVGKVRIVIEHSDADDDDKDRFEIRRFTSLARVERWLKSRETEGRPHRNIRTEVRCAKGVCEYSLEGGINHNNVYLKKITYGFRGGCPYLKTIYLLDGD